MGELIKKNSGFLYWVLVPSLLLVISVFGVNLVSRPGMGGAQCNSAADCNASDPNPCRQYTCTSNFCVETGIDISQPGCGVCGSDSLCGNRNGICEDDELNCDSTGQDCGSPFLPSGCDVGCSGGTRDFCCDSLNCQGTDPNSGNFDIDCACCGDSVTNSLNGEQCDPSGSACAVPGDGAGTCTAQCQCTPNPPACGDGILDPGESCDGTIISGAPDPTNCKATCRVGANQDCTCCGDGVIQTADGEQCDPPNGTTCDASCQTIVPPPIPVCGNGILEAGEACEGTTCSVTLPEDGSVVPGICQACQCFPQCIVEGSGCGDNANTSVPCVTTGGTTTGVASLVPPLVHPTVLAQWLAAFAVPGAVFTGLRVRRKKK
jgi:hypothetical protein